MGFWLEIITGEKVLFQGEVDTVIAPATDGEIGVLPHHAAVMTTLDPGELRYRVGAEETHYVVHGGFMDIRGDRVVVLADAAENAREIDEVRAEEAVRRAEDRLTSQDTELNLERVLASIRRAQLRVHVVRRRVRRIPGA
jgi:F-type H+-transporting ATPase subunit epsilon